MNNSLVYDYGNVNIYQQDLDSLNPENWITDTIIEFEFELLEEKHNSFGFLRPAIVHLLAFGQHLQDIQNIRETFNLQKTLLFIPINDHMEETVGGTHWSLAIFDSKTCSFYYFDSLKNYNLKQAQKICKTLSLFVLSEKQKLQSIKPFFIPVDCPRQINGKFFLLFFYFIQLFLILIRINV
jgi:Ulp1 family protease